MSTGNDIVALALTDKDRTSGYRFYSRILSPRELQLFDPVAAAALTFHQFIWLMWSIKESAYKYVSRANPALVFTPLKISVTQLAIREGFIPGMVFFGNTGLYSRSFVTGETIMTVVSDQPDFSDTKWGIHAIESADYASQSARVRAFALRSISALLPGEALRIVKTPDGPPVVCAGDQPLDIPISLAHHDRYVAWSYRLAANSSSYRKSAAN